jgi:L-asparaginase
MSGSQGQASTYAVSKGAYVVTTTRTGGGSVGASGPGRGGPAGPGGRLSGDDLQPVKARILLMLAIATTSDANEVRRMFREY